jgi:hypothetical protein
MVKNEMIILQKIEKNRSKPTRFRAASGPEAADSIENDPYFDQKTKSGSF